MERRPGLAGGQVARGERLEDRAVLAVHPEHAAGGRRRPEQPEQRRVVDAEVVDHERLERRHAGGDEVGDLRGRVSVRGGDHGAQADVDGGVRRRRGEPLAEPHPQRPRRRRRRSGTRVVEREQGRRPAERRGHGVAEPPVRLRVGRHPCVGVHVDDARQHEQPRCVHDLARARRRPGQVRLDGRDPSARHGDVGSERPGRRDDRAAADDEVGGHPAALSRPRRSRSPAPRPTGSGGPPRAAGPPSRRRAGPSRSGSRPAARLSRTSRRRRTGRRSRTR